MNRTDRNVYSNLSADLVGGNKGRHEKNAM
jgi:hypothetical protein